MTKTEMIASIRAAVRREISQQLHEDIGVPSEEKSISVDKKVQMIVKVAGQGLKAVKLLRNLPDPTQKVKNSVESSVMALEHVFNHMLSAPMEYLDENPQETVAAYQQSLDARAANVANDPNTQSF